MRLVVCLLWMAFNGCFVASQQDCPSSQWCDCSNNIINCICKTRDDLVISTSNNFDVKALVIRHCGTVTISSMAFVHLRLDSVILSDLQVLKIRPIAFFGGVMQHLEISHIANLEASSYGLNGLTNMTWIELTNVTSDSIPHTFMVVSEVQQIIIRNCTFQSVDYQAFAASNSTNIFILNSTMKTLRSKAFTSAGDAANVVFEKVTFGFTENASFVIEANKLVFQNCTFEELYNEVFQADYVTIFIFNGNTVSLARNEAFLYINPNGTVQLKNNHFVYVEENSLTMLLSPSIKGEFDNNTFDCNCVLDWFWQTSYHHLREKSFCILHHGSPVPAKDIEMVHDEQGRCIELNLVNGSRFGENIDYETQEEESSQKQNRSRCSGLRLDAILFVAYVAFSYIFIQINAHN